MKYDQHRPGGGKGLARVYPEPGAARKIYRWRSRLCGIVGLLEREMYVALLIDSRNLHFDVASRRGAMYVAKLIAPDVIDGDLVLKLDAPDLSHRHEDLVNAGYRHAHEKFVPCLTIKHDASTIDLSNANRNMDELLGATTEFDLYRETWFKTE